MRIVKEGADGHKWGFALEGHPQTDIEVFDINDTIEITDAEWDEIFAGYFLQFENSRYTSEGVIHITANQFSQYLRELISLTGEGK